MIVADTLGNLRGEGGGVRVKVSDIFCFNIFCYLGYAGSGTFYRIEKCFDVDSLKVDPYARVFVNFNE